MPLHMGALLAHGVSQTQPPAVGAQITPAGQVPLQAGGLFSHGVSQTQPVGVDAQTWPVGQVPLHVGELFSHGVWQTQPVGVDAQTWPVGQVPLQVGALFSHGVSQTQPVGVDAQTWPVGQVPLHVGELFSHGVWQTQPVGVDAQTWPVGQVPLQVGALFSHGVWQTQPVGVDAQTWPVGQVPLQVGALFAHGGWQTQPVGVEAQTWPVGQVPLQVGALFSHGVWQTQPVGVDAQTWPVGQVPLQVGALFSHGVWQTHVPPTTTQVWPLGQGPLQVGNVSSQVTGGMQTLPGKVSATGCSVPSSMPLARARSVSGLVSLASTVRSWLTQVSVGPHVGHIGGRHSMSVMQNTLAVVLQCGWNGTLTASLACPRTTTHAPLAGAQSSCDMQSRVGASSQCGLTWQTPPPAQLKQVPSGQSARVGNGSHAWVPPMTVEPIEHELPVQSSFMMHMRPVMPGDGLKRQNPKPGSKLAVATIGVRLEISSVMVFRRMRSTGSTLLTVIVQAIGSPTLAMAMGTQDVQSPPGHWSAVVHRSPPLGPPTQRVAVQMPFGTVGGLSQSRSDAHASAPFGPPPAFGPPRQTVRGGQSAAV